MVLMIAIGTGVFLGFHIEWKSLEQNADAFLRETKYADYRLYSESGFTEDDLRSVRGIAGVDAASRFLSIPAAVKGTSSSVALQVTEDAAVSSPLRVPSLSGRWRSHWWKARHRLGSRICTEQKPS